MSTPTPIEIVREHQRWRRAQGQYAGLCQCPHTPEEIGLALDSVLRDAERYKALAAHNYHDLHGNTLAELADKLRSETK